MFSRAQNYRFFSLDSFGSSRGRHFLFRYWIDIIPPVALLIGNARVSNRLVFRASYVFVTTVSVSVLVPSLSNFTAILLRFVVLVDRLGDTPSVQGLMIGT